MVAARGILLCGGGTGGHVMPGLALAAACRQEGATDLRWIGDPERLEARLVPAAGIPLLPYGLSRPRLRSWRWWLQSLGRGFHCFQSLRREPPRVIIALGGYAALLPGLLAPLLRRPLVVCEQNAWPGRTNRLLARRAALVITQFPEARRALPGARVACLGNPVRAFAPSPRGDKPGLRVLVMGGSLAAQSLNDCLAAAAAGLAQIPGLQLLHLAGEADRERMQGIYSQAGVDAEVFGFVDDMAAIYARVDLAVCRAGATTVAEACVVGLPVIYIPLPWAAEDHQTANARAVARRGGAVVLAQQDLHPAALVYLLRRLHGDRAALKQLADGALAQAHPRAATVVAQRIGALVGSDGEGRRRW
ncbi:MAG: UDP-N-acetylglucosamine--N-acetylmuramyl-(pentapeptide) pyrophosphoryl-undecaprenol N-acetylglucosamine transferase [Planctomycetota bacterium]|nr:MAG: UDP-N-acetylglucosamine--N-acetylmuramyl-(pentapeptide) pyrophosphoryl-undecaprenol N-acetylglucosamine transferase [Planctomycetota bacterium]